MRFLGKIIKFIGNFVGVILSLVLSLALLIMLVATPILSGLSAFTRPETIRQVVQEIDFASILLESFQGELSEEEKLEMEFLVELTQTKAFGDLTELYATDLTNAFEEEVKPSVLTKEALRKIARNNMGELVEIVRKLGDTLGEDSSTITDAEMEEYIWEAFEDLADKFLELAPTAEDLRKLMKKVSDEITGSSSHSNERPNSGMEFTEDSIDMPSYDFSEKENEGGGTITYIPSQDGTITNMIINPDGTVETGDGTYSYVVDENGNIIFQGGGAGTGAISGGIVKLGKAVAIQNNTVRILWMGTSPSGSEQSDAGQEEIADVVLKLAGMAKNGTLTLALVGVMAVLALLICLLRWPRFKGLMWVAVMLLIGAVIVALAGVAYTVMPGMVAGDGPESLVFSASKPVIKIISNSMYIAAGIYAAVAIVLIVLFTIFRKALRKQKAAKAAEAARAEAVEEIADEAEAAAELYEEVPAEEFTNTEEIPVEEFADAEEVPVADEVIPVADKVIPAAEEEFPGAEEATVEETEAPAE